MFHSQAPYRALYESLLDDRRRSPFEHPLFSWVDENAAECEWLRSFAARGAVPAEDEELCRLYALSRVNETLLLRFQHGRADGTDWPGPEISPDDYVLFAESLGLSVVEPSTFSPFYHEIVEVEQSTDDKRSITLETKLWPCLVLGDMLFSRAGVRVSAGTTFVRKEVAESSTLYWAYRRKNRPNTDLSVGWGRNSQWRTRFRRDYRIGEDLHYNVDGRIDLATTKLPADDDCDLARDERIELLTHRCFVRTTKPHNDLWPYDDIPCAKASESRG
jgi:hypothetical protein